MTTLRNVLATTAVAGALALAAQPALAFGGHGGGGGFHGGGGGWHGGGGPGWHGGGGGWHGGGPGWHGGGWGVGWGVPFVGFGGPWYAGAYGGYYDDDDYNGGCVLRRVRVQTQYGLRWRTVRYCY